MNQEQRLAEEVKLLAEIARELPRLKKMWRDIAKTAYENRVFRFYDQSYKTFQLQEYTKEIVELLRSLAPHRPLHPWFTQIVAEGTEKEFTLAANQRWLETTRPIVEAFLHARYFLEMAIKYGKELKEPPMPMRPHGWAAVLGLFGLEY